MSHLAIGMPAPLFELNTADGRSRLLREALEQGPAVLAFYKASCPTSQFTFPFLQQIYSKVGKTAGWTLWGISQDDPAETTAFTEQYGITFDVLIDEYPYPVSSAYALRNVPALFMIQSDGIISLSEFGFSKTALNRIAGLEFFTPNDGLPASRPG